MEKVSITGGFIMPKIKYIDKRFNVSTMATITQANEIIEKYATQGMSLTLRQLYYQLVSANFIPNKEKQYRRLSKVISDARLAGLIDWDAIVDRTRNLQLNYHNTDPGDAVNDALRQFMLNRWLDQKHHVEVWIEKDALIGVISSICKRLDVPYFACKGYTSQSEMWRAAQRMNWYASRYNQKAVIIHLGDHDPSGIDMTRDIDDRHDLFIGGIKVERIALNWDQIETYNPPPNPAKMSDSRANDYVMRYGKSSWELDALEPTVIRDLIAKTVDKYIDKEAWSKTVALEQEHKKTLQKVVDNWQTL
jgi:hypothetical protein